MTYAFMCRYAWLRTFVFYVHVCECEGQRICELLGVYRCGYVHAYAYACICMLVPVYARKFVSYICNRVYIGDSQPNTVLNEVFYMSVNLHNYLLGCNNGTMPT